MKVFLSHKIEGLTIAEILMLRLKAIKMLEETYGDIEVIDDYIFADAPIGSKQLWNIGARIQFLERADAIYFCDGLTDDIECTVVMLLAKFFHIKVLNIEFCYVESPSLDDIAKNTNTKLTNFYKQQERKFIKTASIISVILAILFILFTILTNNKYDTMIGFISYTTMFCFLQLFQKFCNKK